MIKNILYTILYLIVSFILMPVIFSICIVGSIIGIGNDNQTMRITLNPLIKIQNKITWKNTK